MKKGFLIVIFICLLIALQSAYAETIKIGYIDVQRILNESRRGVEARKEFQARGNEINNVIQKKQNELKALKESLEKQASMLSNDARREKEREYQRELKELERLVKDSRERKDGENSRKFSVRGSGKSERGWVCADIGGGWNRGR